MVITKYSSRTCQSVEAERSLVLRLKEATKEHPIKPGSIVKIAWKVEGSLWNWFQVVDVKDNSLLLHLIQDGDTGIPSTGGVWEVDRRDIDDIQVQ